MKKLATVALSAILGVSCLAMAVGCGEDEIVVGITDYAPMDYKDENGEWIGFDAELAQKTFSELGYKVKFEEIDWDTKIITLTAGSIDVIWNGMTVTDELKENLLLSDVYLNNQQYAVVKTENKTAYTNLDSLKGKKVAVESGSAAESALDSIKDACTINALSNQNSAIMEVSAGTSDIAIVDYTMAKTLTAEGSSYYGKLEMVDIGFEKEEYAIAFRKEDTELCNSVNAKLKEYTASGYMKELATKYKIENLLVTE